MRRQIYESFLTQRPYLASSQNPAYWTGRIWCAVLLVLPPLGQADISPFRKNLSQAAAAAPAPFTKDRLPQLLPGSVILALFLFCSTIRLFFFISRTLLLRYSGA